MKLFHFDRFQLQNGSERVEPRRREPLRVRKSSLQRRTFFFKKKILLIHNLENYIPIFTEENEISHLTKNYK